MIAEHGVLEPDFHPCASVEDALARAHTDGGVAWVALQDPEESEVEAVFTAVGLRGHARVVANHRWGHAGFIGLPHHHEVSLLEVNGES